VITSNAPEARFQVGRAEFELDRFERTGDERCEVEGRWSGVRGRRFMRPALTVLVDGRAVRLLADLADKPWAAEEGRHWRAAFPYSSDAGEFTEAELTVAPDLTIPLTVAATVDAPRTAESRTTEPQPDPEPKVRARPSELDGVKRELAEAREERRRLLLQLRDRESEIADAIGRADRASAELTRLTRERDEAQRAREQTAAKCETLQRRHAELSAECEAARRAHDEIASERGAALAEQRLASSEREAAIAARDRALAERKQARTGRDRARSGLDTAVRERDQAVTALDSVLAERNALEHANEMLQTELSELLTARGAAWAAHNIGFRPATPLSHAEAVPRALAAIVLTIAIAIVLFIVLPNV
jgi:hypothetical protein